MRWHLGCVTHTHTHSLTHSHTHTLARAHCALACLLVFRKTLGPVLSPYFFSLSFFVLLCVSCLACMYTRARVLVLCALLYISQGNRQHNCLAHVFCFSAISPHICLPFIPSFLPFLPSFLLPSFLPSFLLCFVRMDWQASEVNGYYVHWGRRRRKKGRGRGDEAKTEKCAVFICGGEGRPFCQAPALA